ncbi:MAG: pilus assembly protein PilM [Methylococcales bacterium]|nr:MAG: pilus assembly protein PilM [Methylococcales bacterium]
MSWFNRTKKSSLGIDISGTTIKLLELKRTGNSYQVAHFSIVSLPPDSSSQKRISTSLIAEGIIKALKKSGSSSKQAVVAVTESAIMTKTLSLTASLTDDEMENELILTADQYLPYSLDELNFDFEVQGINQHNTELVDVLLVASRRENVDDRIEALALAGLKASIVDVEGYALENAFSILSTSFLNPDKDDHTIAIVDIGSTLTSLTILNNGKVIYTRSQSIGGKQLTEEIQRHYGLTYEDAGLAKKQGGLPDNYQETILQPFQKSLIQQIQRSLQSFNSSGTSKNIDGIILAGGCASMIDLDLLIQSQLNIPVNIANPFLNMQLSKQVNAKSLYQDSPSLMLACGLALRGFEE